jgi:hypothetical protein
MLPRIKPGTLAIWLVALLFLVHLGCATTCQNCSLGSNNQYIVIFPDGTSTSVTADGLGCASVSISSGSCADLQWIKL